MKITLILPGHIDHSLLDKDNRIDMPEGATLEDLFAILKLPNKLHNADLSLVNGSRVELATKLTEGDTVSFFPVLAGG